MVTSKKKVAVRCGTVFTAAALALPLLSFVSTGTASAGQDRQPDQLPAQRDPLHQRDGRVLAPTNFNPLDTGSLYTGTVGLLYEPLFLYDPIHNKFIPWLATSGSWSGDTYTITVRNGVDWYSPPARSPAASPARTWPSSSSLAKTNPPCPYNANVATVKSVTSQRPHGDGRLHQPARLQRRGRTTCGTRPIVPEGGVEPHVGGRPGDRRQPDPRRHGPDDLLDATTSDRGLLPASTPTGGGRSQLGLSFKFKYLCDEVNASNNSRAVARW